MSVSAITLPVIVPPSVDNLTYTMPDGSTVTRNEARRWMLEQICIALDIELTHLELTDDRLFFDVSTELGKRSFARTRSRYASSPSAYTGHS